MHRIEHYARHALRAGLIAVLIIAPSAYGWNPLDDDAGSGADAGDGFGTATPVHLDQEYRGRLAAGIDARDVYRFTTQDPLAVLVSLGPGNVDLLATLWDPARTAYYSYVGWVGTETNWTFLAPAGEWYLSVDMASELPWPPVLEYAFEIRSKRPVDAVWRWDDRPAYTMEMAWDRPTTFQASVRIDLTTNFTEAGAGRVTLEAEGETFGEPWVEGVSFLSADSSFGPGVWVHPVGFKASSAVSLEYHSEGWAQLNLAPPFGTGWARVVVHHTAPQRVLFQATSDAPLRWASQDLPLVSWSGTGELQAMTPVLSLTGPREGMLEVRERFIGLFTPGTTTGWVEGPDGMRKEVVPFGFHSFRDPTPGSWRFGISPAVGAGPYSDWLHLSGVFVPRLGVATR